MCSATFRAGNWAQWPVLKKFYDHNDSSIVIYDRNDSGLYYKTTIVARYELKL